MPHEFSGSDMDALFPGYDRNTALQAALLSHPLYSRYRAHCPELGRTHPWALVEVSCRVSMERVTGLVICAVPVSGGWDLKQPFEIFTGSELLTGGFRTIDPARLKVTLIGTIPGNAALCAHSNNVPVLNLLACLTANWSSQYGKADNGEGAAQSMNVVFPESFVRFGEGEEFEYGLVVGGTRDRAGAWDLSRSIELYLGSGERITLAPGETAWIEPINADEPILPLRRD